MLLPAQRFSRINLWEIILTAAVGVLFQDDIFATNSAYLGLNLGSFHPLIVMVLTPSYAVAPSLCPGYIRETIRFLPGITRKIWKISPAVLH